MARAQTGWVRERIQAVTGGEVSEVLITTEGDTSTAALTSFGGQGVFVAAVRQALIEGRADVAVHSLKDMPTADDPRTMIAAVPAREDVRDFLVTSADSLDDLPSGARVGTGSPVGSPTCCARARISKWSASAATSTPEWPGSPAVNSTPLCWRWPA